MFTFDDQYKKFEQLTEQYKQATEFWFNAILSSFKDFYKTKK